MRNMRCLSLSIDAFIKSPEERAKLPDDWDLNHLRFEESIRVLNAIRQGAPTVSFDAYIRRPKAHMQHTELACEGVQAVLFEGDFVISTDPEVGNLRAVVDLPIYLDADWADNKRWRYQQESEKPEPRTREEMDAHWRDKWLVEVPKYVEPSRAHAMVIIRFDADHTPHLVQAPPPYTPTETAP